jgi:hypothetical protein
MPNHNTEDIADNESYGSWEESDNEDDIDLLIYGPGDPSLTKYNIVLCELYNKEYHGYFEGDINNHYLALMRFTSYDYNYINIIRNQHPSRFRIEIANCLYLPSDHCVAILKTHWLKLIQRTWKKIYKNKKQTLLIRCHPNSIKYREINGIWPNNCVNYPGLKGMLSGLPRTSSRLIS